MLRFLSRRALPSCSRPLYWVFTSGGGGKRKLRVGIDAHILGKQRGGVETCIDRIVRALAALDHRNEYFVYVTRNHTLTNFVLPKNFHLRLIPNTPRLLQRYLVLPLCCRRDGIDVLHVQRVLPPFGYERAVLHLHDAIEVTCADHFPWWKRFLLKAAFHSSARRAWHVITPSCSSKRQIAAAYEIPSEKISVVLNGVDTGVFYPVLDPGEKERALSEFSVSGPYVMSLGAIERHKDIDVLIEAFARFRTRHPDWTLVIAGKWRSDTRSGYVDELHALAARCGVSEATRFTGHVPIQTLRALLTGASMLVFPAAAEGFGFPPLEAMACGVPAVAADTLVSREVYGDAVLRARRRAPEEFASCMNRIADEPELRSELIRRGNSKVTEYSWETAAHQLIQIYESAGANARIASELTGSDVR